MDLLAKSVNKLWALFVPFLGEGSADLAVDFPHHDIEAVYIGVLGKCLTEL